MEKKGILWLTIPNQSSPVPKIYGTAKHFHVTIKYDVTIQSVVQYLDQNVSVELTENCWNSEIQALRVKLPSKWGSLCSNKDPHMTISHTPSVKPFKSNEMLSGYHKSEIIKNKRITLKSRFFMFGVGEVEKIDDNVKGYTEK